MSADEMQGPTSSSLSPSPSWQSSGEEIPALGVCLTRTLSHPKENREDDVYSLSSSRPPSYSENDSRARDAFQSTSTGRGGLGNIRQASDLRLNSSADNFSPSRGRQPFPSQAPAAIFSTGRGGAGNLRSPLAVDPSPARNPAEQDVVREYAAAHEGAPVSSGRGGLGNISQGSSRAPAIPPAAVYSTGRGGAGNMLPGDARRVEQIDVEAQ
ncbi:hypothetical protein HYPSUDRAFT_209258 [Hypholoma sublateritium FD-334 SS-4]|uniref:Uncharacterized protein n=1 Tax=Hypholoma sublateritium (strain FD-334 SS-4) TaxID=945553 RepID=A0A0D2KGW0_HYPSF|nr:hypothetical protein HYPSUDRAFT_209258 [Hypholoma sublateritium FD-334 SS-4]